MIYGNKWLVVLLLLSFFYIVGCSEKDFYIALYDGYTIYSIVDEFKLYKDEELLEIIANKYDVFISDLPRNRNLQREAVKYIIKHANEYSRKEIIEALDYLYSWEK